MKKLTDTDLYKSVCKWWECIIYLSMLLQLVKKNWERKAFMVGGWHPSICIAFFTPLLSILSIRERVGGTGVALLNMSVWFPCQTYWSLSDSGLHKLWSWLRNISGITTVKEADGLWSPLFLPVPRFCQLHLGSVTFSKLLSYKFYTLNCNVAYTHPL